MTHRTIVSREDKAMLLPERFRGGEEAPLEHAADLWSVATRLAPALVHGDVKT